MAQTTAREDVYEQILSRKGKLAVVGLGYVGLPIAVAFSKKIDVVGFDINERRVVSYKQGIDITGDVGDEGLQSCSVNFSSRVEDLANVRFFIVAVPTPVKSGNVPDLQYLQSASETIARKLTKGAIVVYESTVYPGVTEEVCVPILEQYSGLTCGVDFKVGYSPERINPGDKVNRLENIVKIVSGMDEESLDTIAKVYELVVEAGVHRASSIKVAEAAKVIENAQRDVNIAFMNELSMMFNQMGIDTLDVLAAAGTKWNFMPFKPGLVGGHCIGIDPYYLTYKAEDSGFPSRIILAGRHINDGMGMYVAQHMIKMLVQQKINLQQARIGILGIAYKEDCPDTRNSKVKDIIHELQEYNIQPIVVDPLVEPGEVNQEYGIELADMSELHDLNVIVLAVPHQCFIEMKDVDYERMYSPNQTKIMIDIKGKLDKQHYEQAGFYYWRL